ncbi:uncharacterized protein LOC135810235 [Sycon ciliatum]|uniref:uncharacterized protein LOC135810235 n=1 Tax=Sycon ciliatum TaxID=27933 RepID=UPI0020AC9DFE
MNINHLLGIVGCLTVLGSRPVICEIQDGANVQVVVPAALINAEIEALLPTIIAEVAKYPAITCCYDDVGASHVHLNMQGIKAALHELTAKTSSSATGMLIDGSASLTAAGSYRLCLHDDPFSKHACSTLFDCKGTFSLKTAVSFSLTLAVHGVNVTVVKPSVNISISTNLCSKFRDEINKNMAKIKSGAEHAMAELGPKITHTVMELIKNTTVSIFGNVTAKFALSSGSSTVDGGLVVRALVQLANVKTGAAGPWKVTHELPAIPTANASVDIYVSDTLLSNGLYMVYSAGLLRNFTHNETISDKEYVIEGKAMGPPSMVFNSSHQLIQEPWEITGVCKEKGVSFHATLVAFWQLMFDVKLVNASVNGTFIKPSLELTSDVGVTNVSTSPNCTADCHTYLDHEVSVYKLRRTLYNVILKAIPTVKLPAPIDLTSLVLSFGDGYMKLSVTAVMPKANVDRAMEAADDEAMQSNTQWRVKRDEALYPTDGSEPRSLNTTIDLLSDILPFLAVKCPAIPGAKPDGCI